MTSILGPTGLLLVLSLAACGGSTSDRQPEVQLPSSAGGLAPDQTSKGGTSPAGGSTSGSLGGSSTGGVSAGGSADTGGSVGAGGEASESALTLPPGCRPRAPTESTDICSLSVECDGSASARTNCYRLDSGLWECQCAFRDEVYRVEHAAGIEACAFAARVCLNDELDVGDETCERTSERGDQDSCATDITCLRPIDLDESSDARAWIVHSGFARCERSGSDVTFGCNCFDGSKHSKHTLLAEDAELACQSLADFCMRGEEPSFDGDEQCLPGYVTPSDEGCAVNERCGPTMPLAEGVELVQLADRFASCVASPSGGSDCFCSGQDSEFQFELSTPPDDSSCEAAIPNCDPRAVIEPIGPAKCEDISAPDPANSDGCGATQRCVQEAKIDDRSILARGFLTLTCRRSAPGSAWRCSCASGPDSALFELGAASSNAPQACSQASSACLEQMGLYLGPQGNLTSPPDPL